THTRNGPCQQLHLPASDTALSAASMRISCTCGLDGSALSLTDEGSKLPYAVRSRGSDRGRLAAESINAGRRWASRRRAQPTALVREDHRADGRGGALA